MTDVHEKRAGREFWDSNPCGGQWQSYAAFLDWNERTEPYTFETLDRHEWRGRRVLEVGCGQGAVLAHLRRRGAVAVGLDMSMTSLRRVFEGFADMGWRDERRLLQGDAERLPFPDQSFDAVVSYGVLHHTPDTEAAIAEIRRVLRPDGFLVIMLYRTGTPKWLASRVARGAAAVVERVRRAGALAGWLRPRHDVNDRRGTALLELFGVPTFKAYSNREARAMLSGFSKVTITNHQAGFRRLADVAPGLRLVEPLLRFIDRRSERAWGFYQVIYACRQEGKA